MLSVFFQKFDWELDSHQHRTSTQKKELADHFSNSKYVPGSDKFPLYKHQEDLLNENFFTAPRLFKSKVEFFSKEIETKPNEHIPKTLYIKYKNFICSPKTYFIFETVTSCLIFI